MIDRNPSVGRIVHYVSFGTPGGEYTSQCRAAIVAGVPHSDSVVVDLVVLNPTGLFFNRCPYDVGLTDVYGASVYRGGTWHWPERVKESDERVDVTAPVEPSVVNLPPGDVT